MPTDPKSSRREDALIPGRATTAGTRAFADRQNASSDHFTRPDALWLASIGFGTLRGDPGGVDDLLYRGALADYFEAAGNVVNRLRKCHRRFFGASRLTFTRAPA